MTMTMQEQTTAPPLRARPPGRRKADLLLREHLSAAEAEMLGRYISIRTVGAGEVFWREGERGEWLALITSGKVETSKDTEFGGQKIVVGLHGSGAVIGVESVIDGMTMPETARAVSDVELIILAKRDFDRMLEESPAFAMKSLKGLLQVASLRLRHSIERLATFF